METVDGHRQHNLPKTDPTQEASCTWSRDTSRHGAGSWKNTSQAQLWNQPVAMASWRTVALNIDRLNTSGTLGPCRNPS